MCVCVYIYIYIYIYIYMYIYIYISDEPPHTHPIHTLKHTHEHTHTHAHTHTHTRMHTQTHSFSQRTPERSSKPTNPLSTTPHPHYKVGLGVLEPLVRDLFCHASPAHRSVSIYMYVLYVLQCVLQRDMFCQTSPAHKEYICAYVRSVRVAVCVAA